MKSADGPRARGGQQRARPFAETSSMGARPPRGGARPKVEKRAASRGTRVMW